MRIQVCVVGWIPAKALDKNFQSPGAAVEGTNCIVQHRGCFVYTTGTMHGRQTLAQERKRIDEGWKHGLVTLVDRIHQFRDLDCAILFHPAGLFLGKFHAIAPLLIKHCKQAEFDDENGNQPADIDEATFALRDLLQDVFVSAALFNCVYPVAFLRSMVTVAVILIQDKAASKGVSLIVKIAIDQDEGKRLTEVEVVVFAEAQVLLEMDFDCIPLTHRRVLQNSIRHMLEKSTHSRSVVRIIVRLRNVSKMADFGLEKVLGRLSFFAHKVTQLGFLGCHNRSILPDFLANKLVLSKVTPLTLLAAVMDKLAPRALQEPRFRPRGRQTAAFATIVGRDDLPEHGRLTFLILS